MSEQIPSVNGSTSGLLSASQFRRNMLIAEFNGTSKCTLTTFNSEYQVLHASGMNLSTGGFIDVWIAALEGGSPYVKTIINDSGLIVSNGVTPTFIGDGGEYILFFEAGGRDYAPIFTITS